MYIVFDHVHTCLPEELQCLSEITDISVCLVCSCAPPRGPSQDISSQYLHGASETSAIYRPCFCWYSPAVKIIRVHTNTGPSGGTETHTEQAHYTPRERGGRIESPLPTSVYFSWPLVLFFPGCLSFPCLSHPSILHAIQRLSCFPPLPRRQTPSSWDLCGKLSFKTFQPCVCLCVFYLFFLFFL